MTRLPAALLALALVALSGACSSDDDADRSAGTTATPATSSTTAGSAVTTSVPPSCPSGGSPPGAGTTVADVADLDGDGRADQAFFVPTPGGGHAAFGVRTAAGRLSERPIDSPSPIALSALVVDADEHAPVEILVSDGRGVQLFAYEDCAIVPITNPEGEAYLFDLGDLRGHGTGVGCIETPDGRRLVGLRRDPDSTGDTVGWTRTIVELDGTHARNGATTSGTFTSPADDAAIALLDTVSCGNLTIDHDGITEPTAG